MPTSRVLHTYRCAYRYVERRHSNFVSLLQTRIPQILEAYEQGSQAGLTAEIASQTPCLRHSWLLGNLPEKSQTGNFHFSCTFTR